MTDWADGIETRNYGIRCVIDAGLLSDLLRTIVCLAMVAGALLFYSWVRGQIIATGYETQKLFDAEESLMRVQKRLILEEETLRNPERIDRIARNHLGMVPLKPSQLIPSQAPDLDRGGPDKMAMADAHSTGLKKSDPRRFGEY